MKDTELEKFFNLAKQIYYILKSNNIRYLRHAMCQHRNKICIVEFGCNKLRFYDICEETTKKYIYKNASRKLDFLEMITQKNFEDFEFLVRYRVYPYLLITTIRDPYMTKMRDLIIEEKSFVDTTPQVVDYYTYQIQYYKANLTNNKYLIKQILLHYKKHIPNFLEQLEDFILEQI